VRLFVCLLTHLRTLFLFLLGGDTPTQSLRPNAYKLCLIVLTSSSIENDLVDVTFAERERVMTATKKNRTEICSCFFLILKFINSVVTSGVFFFSFFLSHS